MSNKKQEKIKQARNSLELSSIETAIDCPIGTSTSQPEKGGDISRLAASVSKPKDSHDETDFLAAASSLSGLHTSIETLATTTELLMKLEKHLGLGRNSSGSIDEKNKKQGQALLFEKIWNIIKIIVWIICVYILIRSFLFPGDGQTPSQNSKILGEKAVIINNIPQAMPDAIQNSKQRNDSQEFESLVKLAQSLKILLENLELGEEEDTNVHHQELPKTGKLENSVVQKLADRELEKAFEARHKNKPLIGTPQPSVKDIAFGKGKATGSILLQRKVDENKHRNSSTEIADTLIDSVPLKTKKQNIDFPLTKNETNTTSGTPDADTTDLIVSSTTTSLVYSSSTRNLKRGEEGGEEHSDATTGVGNLETTENDDLKLIYTE